MRPAILVDPYSGAADYGPAFRARGVHTIALLSTPKPYAAFAAGWYPDRFDEVWTHDGDVAALVARVCAVDPLCIVPGNESGVELAETLVEKVLPGTGNTLGGTAARRDKWCMAQTLRAACVPVIRQLCAQDPAEVADWLATAGLEGAWLVLKPPKSGGTDGVHVVAPTQDWRPVFDTLLHTVNRYDATNEAVLVQEFVRGTEYVVDTYSVDGRHGLAELCRYEKSTNGQRLGVYQRTVFLSPDHPDLAALLPYAYRVADVLGIRNGAAHFEIMMTGTGPLLVEVGARAAGTPLQYCARLATGDCQVDRTVRHVLDGAFIPGYQLQQHVSCASLSSPRAGVLRNAEILDELAELPTARMRKVNCHSGMVVPATTDLFTQLGWVVLADPDPARVSKDYDRLRELESRLVITPENAD
jgi:biotin carboxylase